MTRMQISAVRGKQGTRTCYSTMVPLKVVPMFSHSGEQDELEPEDRAQRTLSKSRVPDITGYILKHPEDWVFPSLTASFDAEEVFRTVSPRQDPNLGTLEIPLGTDFLINDGQHRWAAIEEALRKDPGLGEQTICLVLFRKENIERSQQMFSDLNRTVQKTPRPLDILYDHRDPMNRITQGVAEAVSLFKGRVEREKNSLSANSSKFVTLSALYDANEQLIGTLREGEVDEAEVEGAVAQATLFWNSVTEYIPEWSSIRDGDLQPPEARASYIHCHAVGFWAIAAAGGDLSGRYPDENVWKERLAGLSEIDWRKDNPEWDGICMMDGDIITRRQTREATAKYVRWCLGLISEKPGPVLED
jgi:DNA sulfur modification protein DndB